MENSLESITNASQNTCNSPVHHTWFFLPLCDHYKMIDPYGFTHCQVLRSGIWSGAQERVSVRDLAPGVYFTTLIPDKGQPVVTKFAIQH